MPSRRSQTIPPLYLFMCLTLGGSAQGVFANMLLQIVGLALLAWAITVRPAEPPSSPERHLFILALLAVGLVGLQLVPLPASVWPHLGGRTSIAADYSLLGIPVPWLPLSLVPYDSLATVLTLIPPLALLAAILRIGAPPLGFVAALLAGLFAGILLGVMQVSSVGPSGSPWYLYAETNVGSATGFFANADHMATLLVVSIPFLAASIAIARGRGASIQRYSGVVVLVAAAAVVVMIGIALNGSLAGYGLAVPVILASALLLLRPGSPARKAVAAGTAVLLAGAVALLMYGPVGSGGGLRQDANTSVGTRHEILTTSLKAAKAFMPLGSGLGTFPRVYALYEDHDRLDPTTSVNHVHDDYVELALETGLPGVLLLLAFAVWWGRAAIRTWRVRDSGPIARAAAIASAAILVHSVVDFPLRTAAISSCFAMCIALLVKWRPAAPVEQPDLRPTRHVVIR